jgi:glycosyltransferase involved in cell wall biosynthesis
MKNIMKKCYFIANNNIGAGGLSGGDRIFIELARVWKRYMNLSIIGTEEAVIVSKRSGLNDIEYFQTSNKLNLNNVFTLGAIFLNFFKKLANGLLFVIKNRKLFSENVTIYSVSDFYPDSAPAFLIKLMYPNTYWIAGFYLFIPPPWQEDSPHRGKHFVRGFFYWASQIFSYWFINRFADVVFVTSEPDKSKFVTKRRDASRVIVIRGGVNIEEANAYFDNKQMINIENRKYDACFVGRLHYQKGLLVLIDIWNEFSKLKKDAKLALIGNGPLEETIKSRLKDKNISHSVDMFGFLDGEKKFEVFKQSKVILHPATYDSGGMAAAEGMAWGLPGVSFDLEALKTYYPKGMIKIEPGDYQAFAQEIFQLISDKSHYNKISNDARNLILEEWEWEPRAEKIYHDVF